MAWEIEYDPRVEKDLKGIDRTMQQEILSYMDRRIATDEDPRRFGKPLRHERRGLWRYRVRDYRIICDIREGHAWFLFSPSNTAPSPTIENAVRQRVSFETQSLVAFGTT